MKIRYLAWLLPLFFCCCNKGENIAVVDPGFTFTTQYDSVIVTSATKAFIFSFATNVLTGNISGNPVTYTVSGLPANVSVQPASQSVGGLMGGVFLFSFANVAPGTDTLNLAISSAVYGTQNHKLILIILPSPDYSGIIAGAYPGSFNYCTPVDSTFNFSSVVSIVTGSPHTVKISNIRVHDSTIVLTAGVTNIVTIPFQTFGTYSVWGSGNYTHDNPPYDTLYQITIYDTIAHPTPHGIDTEACIMHIQH